MFNFQFFQIHGIVAGIQYVDGRIEDFEIEDDQRMLQFFFFVFGVQIVWYVEPQD